MPLVKLRFEILGDVQLSRAFQAYAHEVEDMSDPLGKIGDALLRTVSDQFRTEGGRTGTKWHPLNASYARWKEAQVGPEPILVFSGWMRDTLTADRAVTVSRKRMVYRPTGEHDDIAIYHQQGEGHNPQRKMIDLTQLDRRNWERIFATWLNELRRGPLWTQSPRTL